MIEAAIAEAARGPARRSRRCARWRSGSPGGSACAPNIQDGARVRLRTLGRARDSRMSPARRSRCRCVSCTWPGTSPCSCPPPAPEEARAVIERRSGAAYDPALAELAARNFDEMLAELDETRIWEQALEQRAVSADLDHGRAASTPRSRRSRRSPVSSRRGCASTRTGVAELAEAAAWRMDLPADTVTARAARRARPRPRPRRRVECDLGEAGTARVRRVGARAAAPALHRARVRPVAGARSDRASWPAAHHERLDGSGYHRGSARSRLSIRPPASSPPPTATRRCARRGRYRPALDAPAAEAELLREAQEGRLDPDAVDAVLTAAGHRVAERATRAARPGSRRASWRCCSRSCAGSRTRRSATDSASPPRPSGTTSSTSTRRPACAAGPPRRSGPSSTTSFTRA